MSKKEISLETVSSISQISSFSRFSLFLSNAVGSSFGLFIVDFYNDTTLKVRGAKKSTTILSLKKLISRQFGIPELRQRLYFKGYLLSDSSTLFEKNIAKHSSLFLVRTPIDSVPKQLGGKGNLDLGVLWRFLHEEGHVAVELALKILTESCGIFKKEPNVVKLSEPISVVSDLHGQFYDLKTIFENGGNFMTHRYLFLGDYVDRGSFSLETVLFLFALKTVRPFGVFLLRGNHESVTTTKRMGFQSEILCKYGEKDGNMLYKACMDAFNALPIAAVITCGGAAKQRKNIRDEDLYNVPLGDGESVKNIFCTHGGLSIHAPTIADIDKVNRFVEPTTSNIVRDLLWADPNDDTIDPKPTTTTFDVAALRPTSAFDPQNGKVFSEKMFAPSARGGVVKIFSAAAVNSFLKANRCLCVVRGHQQKAGFEFHKKSSVYNFPGVITLFSAPNYTDHSKNTGAIMTIKNGLIEIKEYPWRLHPMYNASTFTRDIEREDFHQFVYFTDETALFALTEEQLDHAFKGLYPRAINQATNTSNSAGKFLKPDGKRDLWKILKYNLSRVPELAGRVSKLDSLKRTKAMIAWFATMDHLKKSLEREQSYELYYDDSEEEDGQVHDPGYYIKKKMKAELGDMYSDSDEDYDSYSYSSSDGPAPAKKHDPLSHLKKNIQRGFAAHNKKDPGHHIKMAIKKDMGYDYDDDEYDDDDDDSDDDS